MSETHIRLATVKDADAILAIYAPYIATPVTFEETVPSTQAFRERVANVLAFYPFLVAELDGEIAGYAYAHPLRERQAYQWNAELSIYLKPDVQGHGLGTKLYSTLIELLRVMGIKAVYGVVTAPNIPSRHLHLNLGFERLMDQKNAGYTCGKWHDMRWFVKYIGEFNDAPTPPVAFPDLQTREPQTVTAILAQANA